MSVITSAERTTCGTPPVAYPRPLSLFLVWVDIPKVLTARQMVELLKDIKYCCLNR